MIISKFLTLYKLVMEHLDYSTPPGIVSNSKFPSTNALNIPFTFEFGSHSMSMKKRTWIKKYFIF